MFLRQLMSGIFVSLFVSCCFTGIGQAATLILQNGDRLSGTIKDMTENQATLKTSYAGEIVIKWDQVTGIESSDRLTFRLADGTVIKGITLPTDPGKIRVKAGEILETAPIDLAMIDAINPPERNAKAVKVKGRFNLSASVADGNSDTKAYFLDGEMVARSEQNRFTIGASYNAAEDEGRKTEENWKGNIKYDHFLDSRVYLYANSLLNRDRFKDLNLRTNIGIGGGYQLWESEDRNLAFEAGLGYTNEDYEIAADTGYPSGRWAVNYDQKVFKTPAHFFHKHELLIGLEDVKDLYFQSQTGVRLPLVEKFNATFQVDVDWDNTPSPGNEHTDTYYRLGVGYAW